MDKLELIQKLSDYLDSKGLYWDFISWMESQGYSEEEVEKLM